MNEKRLLTISEGQIEVLSSSLTHVHGLSKAHRSATHVGGFRPL